MAYSSKPSRPVSLGGPTAAKPVTVEPSTVTNTDRPGTGYWSRNRHEILLIGTKGKVVAPAPGTQWDSVILAPVEEHSRKPDIFLEMIESYYPNVPKLELNRRGSARLGWHAWGNEAKSLPKGSTPLAEAGVAEVREA